MRSIALLLLLIACTGTEPGSPPADVPPLAPPPNPGVTIGPGAAALIGGAIFEDHAIRFTLAASEVSFALPVPHGCALRSWGLRIGRDIRGPGMTVMLQSALDGVASTIGYPLGIAEGLETVGQLVDVPILSDRTYEVRTIRDAGTMITIDRVFWASATWACP